MSGYNYLNEEKVTSAFKDAKGHYEAWNIDVDSAIETALQTPVSIHCWQADDVRGLETKDGDVAGGGIMATGNFPGAARNGDELRQDYEKVLSLLPGKHRLNLHASYCETGDKVVDRDELAPEHFSRWVDWGKENSIKLDFNPTYFAHPRANDGFTLSHRNADVRDFWIRHGITSRKIAQYMGEAQGSECVNNHWIPDGDKDSPADRWGPRARLVESLDAILSDDLGIDKAMCVDAVESKLFGLGSEDFVVGSAEFYNHYAITRNVMYCMDMGHFHPTETIHGKFSSLLQFHKRLLLHVSRPIRWDSDHVVIFNDDLKNVFLELKRGNAWDRAITALDFFDASINRIAAYIIGIRATRKAMLYAMLDPTAALQKLEAENKRAEKLALMEEFKTMPFEAVWNQLCLQGGAAPGTGWIDDVQKYEVQVLANRA